MNLFAALVNPNAPSTNTMGRRHPSHRVSGLVQRLMGRVRYLFAQRSLALQELLLLGFEFNVRQNSALAEIV